MNFDWVEESPGDIDHPDQFLVIGSGGFTDV